MRIVFVCSDLGVRVPGTKGASLHLQSISQALVDVGHEVLLVGVRGHGDPPAGPATLLLDHPGRTTGRQLRRGRPYGCGRGCGTGRDLAGDERRRQLPGDSSGRRRALRCGACRRRTRNDGGSEDIRR